MGATVFTEDKMPAAGGQLANGVLERPRERSVEGQTASKLAPARKTHVCTGRASFSSVSAAETAALA